jgi:hypothetical protein
MKTKQFLLTAIILAMMPMLALAQGAEVSAGGGYSEFFLSLGAVAGLVAVLTEFFSNLFEIEEGAGITLLWFKLKTVQFISFLVGVAAGLFGFLFNLGMFVGVLWWHSLLIGLGAAFIANGFADTGTIKWVLERLGVYLRSNKLKR